MRMYSSGTIRYNNTTIVHPIVTGTDETRFDHAFCVVLLSAAVILEKRAIGHHATAFYRSPIFLFHQFFPRDLHRVSSGSFAVVRLYNTRFSGWSRGPHLCNVRVHPRLEKTADIRDPVFVCVCAHVSSMIVFATVNRNNGPF